MIFIVISFDITFQNAFLVSFIFLLSTWWYLLFNILDLLFKVLKVLLENFHFSKFTLLTGLYLWNSLLGLRVFFNFFKHFFDCRIVCKGLFENFL